VNPRTPKVETAREGPVGVITLNHPPHNLLSREVIEGIAGALDGLLADPAVRAVVLTGAGDCFSYGADIGEIADVREEEHARELCTIGHDVFHRFWTSPVPTIAALNGKCMGGGLEIALACHFRVAAAGIRIGFPEIRLGLIPGWGGTQRMIRWAGPSVALDYILTGRMMDPEDARAIGIVNLVTPRGETLAEAKRLGRRIAEKSRPAVEEALGTVRRGIEMDLARALEDEAGAFARLCGTAEKAEGVRAFFEGRRPRFTDRGASSDSGTD
jgi:enoyl-CoA hydratase/carnithine racemase